MNDRKFLSDNIKAVILDFDGTVGNSRGLIVRTMQQTIRRLGLPERSEEECASMIGLPLKETFTRIIDMDDAMGDRCAEVYREIFKENNRPGVVSLFPNVRETLDAIHRSGRMITLASSRSRRRCWALWPTWSLADTYLTCSVRAMCPTPSLPPTWWSALWKTTD